METTSTSTPSATTNGKARHGGGNGWIELAKFLPNPLAYLTNLREKDSSPLVPFQLGKLPCYLVVDPEYVQAGLHNEDWPPISRGRLTRIRHWFTEGMFVEAGAEHHRQRDDVWKPILDDPRIPGVAVDVASAWIDNWKEGQPVEVFSDTRALCYTIDWKAMTGEDLREEPRLMEAFETGADTLAWVILPMGKMRWRLSNRTKALKAFMDAEVTKRIEERRRDPAKDDLLATLVRNRDQPGSPTTDQQVRATVEMYFGADQLHAMFTWTLYLLSQNPEVEQRFHEEIDRVLGDRSPTEADLGELLYLRKVIKESMRLYPPVWGFFREMVADYTLNGHPIPKGTLIGFSPWVTQRDPRYWPDPLRFDPERWNSDAPKQKGVAYFPMSAGPYWCHGGHLAMKEAALILALIGQRWTMRPASSEPPTPIATWATEPKGGLRMIPSRR